MKYYNLFLKEINQSRELFSRVIVLQKSGSGLAVYFWFKKKKCLKFTFEQEGINL